MGFTIEIAPWFQSYVFLALVCLMFVLSGWWLYKKAGYSPRETTPGHIIAMVFMFLGLLGLTMTFIFTVLTTLSSINN